MLDTPKKLELVVIGNGMAGMRTIETLLERAPGLYDITVFGAEPYGNYNRILLSPVLAGEKTVDDIILNAESWYEEHDVRLRKGETIDMIDRRTCEVVTENGARTPYDRLLIATGSNPIILPVPGADLPGVVTFREIRDVNVMLEAASTRRNAVVIGGGLLGLEAANGLMKRGMNVTVVHLVDTLMERQLDSVAGGMLRQTLEARGMRFKMPAQTQAIVGEDRVTGVRFADGDEIAADLVVMAVGIRPNIGLAKKAKIYCERGIVVSDTMQTYDGRIYAVGECVQHRRQTYGLVAPLFDQAKVCANHLAMKGFARYEGSSVSTKLKVTGIDLFSAGDFTGGNGADEIVLHDAGAGIYKRLVLRDNRLVGAVLYGDTGDGAWYFQQMREGVDVSTMRDRLMFGEAQQSKGGHAGHNRAVEMSDETEVCGCNGVCKGAIVKAIAEKKLFTVEDVRAHTKASASCGSCTGLVEQILASTLGDYSEAPKVKPLCGCTSFSHDQVRGAIAEQSLKTIPEVMDFMEWSTPDGCPTCRPALNYYLLAAWPGEYRDDQQSRFINERVHANIQRDGTFSIVPRMWGGVTSPKELRAIADIADKFAIPSVKVTGGQRIDLLGVKKEDLPKVWADLNDAGLVSGHAYAKGLRTVKTCVGTDWCRFGTQDSTGLGIRLEKFLWGSWTPAKVKLAVSGCPRNCAEATCKDVGVICVDSGYEIQFAGAAGLHIKGTEFLTKVATEDECIEIVAALTQLYREQGRYLERMYKWCDRVGLEAIRKAVVDDVAGRKALFARFAHSQQFAQHDPWNERARGGVAPHEFIPMAELELA
ncbi:MAG: nitrite reductase large subunit NirB [Roseiarcus sp.]